MKLDVQIDEEGKVGVFCAFIEIFPGENAKQIFLKEIGGKKKLGERKRKASVSLSSRTVENWPYLEFRCCFYDGRGKSKAFFFIKFPADTSVGEKFCESGKNPKDLRRKIPLACTIKRLSI